MDSLAARVPAMTLLEQATRQTPSDYVPNSVLQCLHLSGIQPRAALRPDALQPPAMVWLIHFPSA